MLRKIRIALAVVFLAGITLLFAGIGQNWWGWMAKLQFIPAVYRLVGGFTLGNLTLLAFILLLTLAIGRIYCSVICPMGVFQDVVIWLRRRIGLLLDRIRVRRIKEKRDEPGRLKPFVKHFAWSKSREYVRGAVLAVSIASAVAVGQMLIMFIAPYSTYGRAVRSVIGLSEGESAAPALLAVSLLTVALIAVCAWLWGRAWCNTICPVGTLLGYVSRHSLLKIRIDEDKCNGCGRCVRGCKSSCIDEEHHTVDHSRCVDCFDCIGRCKQGAISFGPARKASETPKTDKADEAADASGRRAFLGTAALLLAGTAAKAQEMKLDGGLAPLLPKTRPERGGKLVPAGALSLKNFEDHCTSCLLCVGACPGGVLKPGSRLGDLFQPEMDYSKNWCRPECTACADICPSGAIRPISREAKTGIRVGTAHVDAELCLAATGAEGCGNCERHCPSGAIQMVREESTGKRRPVVMEEQCTGCGACEALCPVRPLSAITVTALATHIVKN